MGRGSSTHLPPTFHPSHTRLARIYNDQSVMENHHCAMSFAVLSRPDAALLAHLSAEAQRSARRAIIAAILCTDMANHFKITQARAHAAGL